MQHIVLLTVAAITAAALTACTPTSGTGGKTSTVGISKANGAGPDR